MKVISFKNDILPLKDKLFRLALRITRNREEAEDIVQDTLMKIWSQRDNWSKIQNIETFSMTICRNRALDIQQKHERMVVSLDEETHDRPDNATPADEQMIQAQKFGAISKAISQLPEKQRTIIQLRDIEGKPYQEIADIIGISLQDVKVNLFRARQKLKSTIGAEQN
ncbi:MAG: RNA polymerase sigma factor [Bacteroidaceae bacterium]|nr:RNA polymerase sigma factor [Bacteroidaceae bacterium]